MKVKAYGPWIKVSDDDTILEWSECCMPDCGATATIEMEDGKRYCREHAHAFEETVTDIPVVEAVPVTA